MTKLLFLALIITCVFANTQLNGRYGIQIPSLPNTVTSTTSYSSSSQIGGSVIQSSVSNNVNAGADNKITLDPLGSEINDPDFLRILNNYFGCKNWENG